MGNDDLQVPQRITIHCADTPNGVIYPAEKIRAFHMAPPPQGRGWSDIGYHKVIQPDGQIENGRPLNRVGAHVEGHNKNNLGICLIGTDKFSRRQLDALRGQLDSLRMLYFIPTWELYAHCQWDTAIKQGKTCPNIPINVILAWYIGHEEKALAPYLLPPV